MKRPEWLAIAGAAAVVVAGALLVVGGRGHRRGDGHLGGEARPGGSAIVEIESTPAGAEVLEDGQARGVTPLVLPVAPGREVVIELVRPGYERVRRLVTASPGEPVSIRVELTPVAAGFAPPSDRGVP